MLSFVSATGDITNFNVDLKEFFDYLVREQGVAGTQVRSSFSRGAAWGDAIR